MDHAGQITRLTSRIDHFDNMAKGIAEVKFATLPQINNLHSLPNSLPCELLVYIFCLACPPIDFSKRSLCESDDDDYIECMSDDGPDPYLKPRNKHDLRHCYFPIVLSAVCSHWREVVQATPEPWTSLPLEVIGWKLKTQVPLLRLYLTNAGPLPVSLDLDMRLQQTVYMEVHEYDAPFIELKKLRSPAELIFEEFPHKIQTLRLAGAPRAWVTYLSELRLPRLQDLALGWIDDLKEAWFIDLKDGTFEIAPHRRITDAFLDEVRLVLRPSSPMPPLITLHFRNVHIDVCTKILHYCPYLVEFYCYGTKSMQMGHYGGFPLAYLHQPFTLPNIERFGWTTREWQPWNIALLENIRLPSLKELQWCGFPEDPAPHETESIFRFFSNLPGTVRAFSFREFKREFFDGAQNYDNYLSLLSKYPHVESPGFIKCSGNFMKSILFLLSNRISQSKRKLLLPQLNNIILRNYRGDEDKMGRAFLEMLEARRLLLHISSLGLEAVNSEVMWYLEVQDKFRGLAYEFALTVTEK